MKFRNLKEWVIKIVVILVVLLLVFAGVVAIFWK